MVLSSFSDISSEEIDALHRRCGFYTRRATAERLLDWIGWTADADLTATRLLEPACGDGAFLMPAVERLLASRHWDRLQDLGPRILAYEIHPREARRARCGLRRLLIDRGLAPKDAARLARRWVRTGDFLLDCSDKEQFSHVATNPPYLRWSSLPQALARSYERVLPAVSARGDLCLAFIDKILSAGLPDARIGLLVSDRWIYGGYAERFRRVRADKLQIERCISVDATEVFQESVSAYPVLMLLHKRRVNGSPNPFRPLDATGNVPAAVDGWFERFPGLEAAGCLIRVGPALGYEPAFVLSSGDEAMVEPDRIAKFVAPREIRNDRVDWAGRHVLSVHDQTGLIDLRDFPRTASHLERYRERLMRRACVNREEVWYRTIDRNLIDFWREPKLLVPELMRVPRLAADEYGFVPSHGIYAIFSRSWPLDVLYCVLACGVLGASLAAISPRVGGGSYRCYKRFLIQVPLPEWGALADDLREGIVDAVQRGDAVFIASLVARLYQIDEGILTEYSTDAWRQRLPASLM